MRLQPVDFPLNRGAWKNPVSAYVRDLRAGARRRYNRERRDAAALRRVEVLALLERGGYSVRNCPGTSVSVWPPSPETCEHSEKRSTRNLCGRAPRARRST